MIAGAAESEATGELVIWHEDGEYKWITLRAISGRDKLIQMHEIGDV